MTNLYIGIDIGGTNIDIVASKSLEDISFYAQESFSTNQVFEEGIKKIQDTIQKITPNPNAIGIGVPGSVKDGNLTEAFNLKQWADKPIVKILEKKFNCPVYMNNDAITGILGEVYFGMTEKVDFFYLTWGTGIGAAMVEWNNNQINVSRPENRTPLHKLESKIGGLKIEKRFGKKASLLYESEWIEILEDLKETLPNLANIYNHELFVIGGGITSRQKNRIANYLKDLNFPKVRLSKLEEKSGSYGALALIKKDTSN